MINPVAAIKSYRAAWNALNLCLQEPQTKATFAEITRMMNEINSILAGY